MPLIPKVGRRKLKIKVLVGSITLFLWIGVVLHLFPVWWMFTTSIKPYGEVFQFPPSLWPHHPTLVCYRLFFFLATGEWGPLLYPVYVYLKNSCIITGATLAIQIPVTSLLAYAISKLYGPKWNRFLFLYCIGTLMIPASVSLIPSYLIIQHFPFPTRYIPNIPFTTIRFPTFNFFNTYWGVILPASYGAFNFLLFKGFFDGIPDELINAARLDGASELGIFRRIILPLSKPVFAVTAYFTFSTTWNSFLWPLMVLQKEDLYPLSVLIYRFQDAIQSGLGQYGSETISISLKRLLESGMGVNGIMAISVIESIPVFIMFIIFREQLMKGIKLRGFK